MTGINEVIRGINRIKTDEAFAQRVYASLCNTQWKHDDESDDQWDGCTWRSAGAFVAEIRGNHAAYNYMDFYCSGNEGVIDPEFAEILSEHGWKGRPYE
jgi:hypothetical protein